MATASHIQLSSTEHPEYFRVGKSQESVDTASGLLQKNHDDFHIFFNQKGFHNHTAHHIITLWALGASPDQLEQAYNNHASYQRAMGEPDAAVVKDMKDPLTFREHINQEQHYTDYLALFQSEIEATSWPAVVKKYLLARDDRADDLLCRFFAGFLHPIIHAGFGIETKQPAIVAEGLAMAAVSSGYMSSYFLPIEKLSQKNKDEPSRSIVDLLDIIHEDIELRAAPHWDDDNKLRDGIIARAGDKMISVASQFRVKSGELERKTAEMTNAAVYYTAGAQRETHERKYDFYYSTHAAHHLYSEADEPSALCKLHHILLRVFESRLAE
ncbi:hypothetical protein LTR86_004980 [Recurvomyces mirabilis]|nr:hypothetical protein LTR86_004980 [Recurvomyces mirabilis]